MNVTGHWINQYGSTIELEDDNGVLAGWYCSRKGRAASGKKYRLSGHRNDELVVFYVNWEDEDANLRAITSFSGRCVRTSGGGEQIHTVWVLARQFEDEAQQKPTGAWNAFLTNADVFTRDPRNQ